MPHSETSLQGSGSVSLFDDGRPVYIYGAGTVGKEIARILQDRGIQVVGLLDRRAGAHARERGIPILKPDDSSLSDAQRERSHVIIGIFNRDVEIQPIMENLQAQGYGRITSFLEFHGHFAAELGDRFWLTSRDYYRGRKEEIAAGDDLWSDETSRRLYRSILDFRLSQSHHALPPPDLGDQYFSRELPSWSNPIRFIDCGAYQGDTLIQLLDGQRQVEAIAAFEPDPVNFAGLVQAMRTHSSVPQEAMTLIPCGVGAETAQFRFTSGQGEASCVSDEGETVIQCVSLDDALPGFRPTLIKMDIEGAEVAAMHGARGLIERYRPGLALSVYHRPDHLWTIPLLAQEWLGGGRHYLRMHAHNGFDVIYYWMP